jgi:hypothetical protein
LPPWYGFVTEPPLNNHERIARKNALFWFPRTNLCGGNTEVTER